MIDFVAPTWNKTNNSTVFTVDAFRSITVDKKGTVWAGSDLGGLYYYNGTIWTKAATYTDVTFKDLRPSVIAGDTSIWAASIGKSGVQATTGGAYHILKDGSVIQYGTATNGGLSSRYANAIAQAGNGTVYVALAQSLTGTTTLEGGVFKIDGNNPPAPSGTAFTKAINDGGSEILYQSAGNRGEEVWLARSASCNSGVCSAPYIARLNSSGGVMAAITGINSPLPFTNSSASPFARAIFTDTITGNTYIGLSGATGTMGVMKADGTWKMLTTANSGFPAGASVNFNAITEVYGQIWVGTTSGVFVYSTSKSLDDPEAFKLYTTADGLPANSVTDIAVDTSRFDVWITSPAGVSRYGYNTTGIKGTLFSVFCNKPDSTLQPSIQQKAITSGATVKLFYNGEEKESVGIDENGNFELTEGEEGKKYVVQISYPSSLGVFKYVYNEIAYDSLIGPVLIPDSLIKEIKAFVPTMERKCFPLQLPLGFSYDGFACRDAFIMDGYSDAYMPFFDGLSQNHKKQVENLADFYVSMASVYSLGGTTMELMNESFASCLDAIHSLLAFLECGTEFGRRDELKIGGNIQDKEAVAILVNSLKLMKEGFTWSMSKAAALLANNPEEKKNYEAQIGVFSDAADLALQAAGNGFKGGALNTIVDLFKRIIAVEGTASTYKAFCRNRHERFIPSASMSAKLAQSTIEYVAAYNNLYNPNSNSLVKYAADTLEHRKENIDALKKTAKVADAAAGIFDAVAKVSVLVAPQLAGVSKVLATGAKVVQTGALAMSMLQAGIGAYEVAELSSQVIPKTGFYNYRRNGNPKVSRILHAPTQHSPTDLVASKNAYNLKLTEYKNVVNSPYDSAAHASKYLQLMQADSAYTEEMRRTLNRLWASADSAVLQVPGFSNKMERVIDSFVSRQFSFRHSLYFNRAAYVLDTDKLGHAADITSTVSELLLLNDSAVNGISYLIDDVNANGIAAPARLVQDGYTINHDNQPGSSGAVTYRFTNYGTVPQNGVSFKIQAPTGGFTITSTDSIYVGTIAPGATQTISFNFSSPMKDTVGRYLISVKASNGFYQNVSGSLVVSKTVDTVNVSTVKAGKWSEPATWSSNQVPGPLTHVTINHVVAVDIDANCSSLKAVLPGSVTVNTGIKLNVRQ